MHMYMLIFPDSITGYGNRVILTANHTNMRLKDTAWKNKKPGTDTHKPASMHWNH